MVAGKTSIVILSYNTFEYTKLCIDSIREWTKIGTYELIVVDNASTDGSVEWLKQQADIKCILNSKNEGFPRGCNQGMTIATGSEILLLNSDTIVTPRWLEQMLTALYSRTEIGAVGCVTNSCSNAQQIDVPYKNLNDLPEFADHYNQSNPALWEKRLSIVGFCFLFKREAYEKIGEMDERFSPGNYEDDDYCLRLWEAGYEVVLCRDTYIHHFGSASFLNKYKSGNAAKKREEYNELIKRNFTYFREKWGVSEKYKQYHNIIFQLPEKIKKGARIIDVDCGCGGDLMMLQSQYPMTEIYGISKNEREAKLIERVFNVQYCKNIETDIFPFLEGEYDYIIVPEPVEEFAAPEKFIERLSGYLSPCGEIYFFAKGEFSSRRATIKNEKKIKISACVITKNEENNIKIWLKGMKNIADEIIVVDTGSVDNTLQLAKDEGARVYAYEWEDDFAAAKNFALEKANGDWILFLDADEYFTEDTVGNIYPYLESIHENKMIDALLCQMFNVDADNDNRIINGFRNVRIFRNDENLRYRSKVHEHLIRKNGPLRLVELAGDIEIYHTGYSSSIVKGKLERNLKILEADIEEHGEKPWHYGYLADCYYGLKDYEKTVLYAQKSIDAKIQAVGNETTIYRRLIDAMALSGKNDAEMLAVIEKAIMKFPEYPEFLWNKASVLFRQMDFVSAEKYILKIMDLQKKVGNISKKGSFVNKESMLYAMYGDIYVLKGDNIRALQQYKISLQKYPYNALVLQKFYRLLRQEEAVDVIEILQTIYAGNKKDEIFVLEVLKKYPLDKVYIYYAKRLQNQYEIIPDGLSFSAFIAGRKYREAASLSYRKLDLAYKCMIISMIMEYDEKKRHVASVVLPASYKNVWMRNEGNGAERLSSGETDIYSELQDLVDKIRAESHIVSASKPAAAGFTSIIMPVYNHLEFTKLAIESIFSFTKSDEYELIVVDNASVDGTSTWLKEQPGLRVVTNMENKGFIIACNQGIEIAKGTELLFLQNDVIVTADWLTKLKQELYSDAGIGAVGPLLNGGYREQAAQINIKYENLEEMHQVAEQIGKAALESKAALFLNSVCLLVRKEVVNAIGFFDEGYSPGYLEDIDYTLRIIQAGYKLKIIQNLFIHHQGNVTFADFGDERQRFLARSSEYFKQKWGFDPQYSANIREDLFQFIDEAKKELAFLDIGCACGGNLMKIKAVNPKAKLYGIELNPGAAAIASCFGEILNVDVENIQEHEWQLQFDYILMGDILEHLHDPWRVLREVNQLLKDDGSIIVSLPNIMHSSILKGLLEGRWEYQDAGILDRTHLRFFTKKEIQMLFAQAEFEIVKWDKIVLEVPECQDMIDEIMNLKHLCVAEREQFDTYQWLIQAKKK